MTITIFLLFSCDNENVLINRNLADNYLTIDSLITQSGNYSEVKLDSLRKHNPDLMNDSIQYPHIFSLEFNLVDIIDFKTNKSDYIIKTEIAAYNKRKELIIENDSILNFNPDVWFTVIYEGNIDSDEVYNSDFYYDGEYFHKKEMDSMHQWSKVFESKKYLNWDMSDYPFDVQELKIEIEADLDSTMIRFRESKEFPARYSEKLSLPQGFEIKSIDFTEKFIKTGYVYDNGEREIKSIGEFNIKIKRSGFSLFIKLFLGAFLSILLSISVFYIPNSEFDAKSQVSVGAIFAAVGNKYFVDSSTISNVLTASDVINNLVILIVIFNVFVIIAQRSERLNLFWLDKEGNGVKLSIFFTAFIALVTMLFYL